MKQPIIPKPPESLGDAGQALWNSILTEFSGVDDSAALTLLLSACRAEDDAVRFRNALASEGDTVTDNYGRRKAHPLLAALKDAETVKRLSLNSIDLRNIRRR